MFLISFYLYDERYQLRKLSQKDLDEVSLQDK